MKVEIKKGKAKGFVEAPPSKSMAHRLLICAGLSEGVCTVHGISESEDVLATLDCLRAIGAEWSREGDRITVRGTDMRCAGPADILRCRESGSTLRFFVPICLVSGANFRASLSVVFCLLCRSLRGTAASRSRRPLRAGLT